jgi:hypothetical protein
MERLDEMSKPYKNRSRALYHPPPTAGGKPYIHYCTQLRLYNDDQELLDWIDTDYMFQLALESTGFGNGGFRNRKLVAPTEEHDQSYL